MLPPHLTSEWIVLSLTSWSSLKFLKSRISRRTRLQLDWTSASLRGAAPFSGLKFNVRYFQYRLFSQFLWLTWGAVPDFPRLIQLPLLLQSYICTQLLDVNNPHSPHPLWGTESAKDCLKSISIYRLLITMILSATFDKSQETHLQVGMEPKMGLITRSSSQHKLDLSQA